MTISVKNDVASCIQIDNKLVLTPHKNTVMRGNLSEEEMMILLACYTSYLRDAMRREEE